jgi:hypothetical protein
MGKTKICYGPLHPAPTRLPLTNRYWYFNKVGRDKGKPLRRCIGCVNFSKRKNNNSVFGTLPVESIAPLVTELVSYYKTPGAAAAFTGVSETTLRSLLEGRHSRCQARVALKIIEAVRHKRAVRRVFAA